ncbi:hypothetical protein N0V90_007639 [Kalmusia sp. IMI 367209]|nr:hypothetical protein N0V90_007639 [Kalmusia sp. IMI 367209]
MVKAVPGTLVKCDPSIKALILEIDRREGNEYVIEDLGDEEHLLIKDVKIERLKHREIKLRLHKPQTNPDSDVD